MSIGCDNFTAEAMADQIGPAVVTASHDLTKPHTSQSVGEVSAASPALTFANPRQLVSRGGRPPVFAPPAIAEAAARYPRLSHRSLSDRLHAAVSEQVLTDDAGQPLARFAWLFTGRRLGLRSELGRLRNTATILTWAEWLCEHRPATRAGMEMMRRQRLGPDQRSASARELGNKIIDTLNAYARLRRGVRATLMHKALAIADAAVTKMERAATK